VTRDHVRSPIATVAAWPIQFWLGWILPDLPAKDLVELVQRQMTDEGIVAQR
jgi:hypothetical protein